MGRLVPHPFTTDILENMRARETERRFGSNTKINDRKKESQRKDLQDATPNIALSCLTVQAVRFPIAVTAKEIRDVFHSRAHI